jgi:hypothetical protein
MKDRGLYRLLNTSRIQLLIDRDDVPQLQVRNLASCTGYLAQLQGTVQEFCQ